MAIWKLEIIGLRSTMYDRFHSMVIRASSEEAARSMARANAADSGPVIGARECDEWLDPERTSCVLLEADGPAGIICSDFSE